MRFMKRIKRKNPGRLLSAVAAVCLCICFLWGCSGRQEQEPVSEDSISVYYINKAETKITPVVRALESEKLADQVEEALNALQENPVELSLRTPVNGYTIQRWELDGAQLILDVSAEYGQMQSTTEVLIRAAIVRTLTQISGVEHVVMTMNGEALTDSLGILIGPMTADMFIDNAGNEINAYEKVWLKLYYANESGNRLVPVYVNKVYSSNISMEKLVLETLIAGPDQSEDGAYPVINPATKVLNVTVKDGTCYVNLDDGFMSQIYNVTGDVSIYAIVNSLAEVSNINKVQIAVNGETDLIYRETFNLANVYDRNLDLVYDE